MCPGRVNLTKNLMADRWSKVMINATFSGMSTVCADTFYYVIHTERALTCAVRIGRECIRVCHAMGITLPSIFGLDFNKLFDYNDIAGQNAAIATVQKIFGTIQGKASMLQDLENVKFDSSTALLPMKAKSLVSRLHIQMLLLQLFLKSKIKNARFKTIWMPCRIYLLHNIIICNTYTPLI